MGNIVDFETVALLVAVSVIANRFIAGLVTPLFDRFEWEKWPLMYVSWVIAGLLSWAFNLNVFVNTGASPVIGILLTAVFAGGAANIFHDSTEQMRGMSLVMVSDGKDCECEAEG